MTKFNYYKYYPLVRKGNELYYGYMGEKYVARIQIMKESDDGNGEIYVYKISTDTNLPVQKVDRKTLYDALDIAYTWLELAKKEEK